MAPDQQIIKAYKQTDIRTADISDALEVLGINGVLSGLKPLHNNAEDKLVGPALSIRQVPTKTGGVFREQGIRTFEGQGMWDYCDIIEEKFKKVML